MLSKVGGGEVINAGTILYSPPEIISKMNLRSNPKIDVWSLGVILYVILTKEFPFTGDNEFKTFTSIMKDEIKFPSSRKLSKEVRDLIKNMLMKEQSKRYSIADIKRHPWIKHMFPNDQGYHFETVSLSSHSSDFYDDSNPENKFNKSRRFLGKDNIMMTRLNINGKPPNLKNTKANLRKIKDKRKLSFRPDALRNDILNLNLNKLNDSSHPNNEKYLKLNFKTIKIDENDVRIFSLYLCFLIYSYK